MTRRGINAESSALKNFAALVRRKDLTHQQFVQHWANRHAEIAMSVEGYAEFRARYVQNRSLQQPVPGASHPGPDGLAEVWLQPGTLQDGSFERSRSYVSTVKRDEVHFLDLEKSMGFQAREHRFIEGRGDCKMVALVRRKPQFLYGSSFEHWRAIPQPAATPEAGAVGRLRDLIKGYTWNTVVADTARWLSGEPVAPAHQLVGVAETWFVSRAHAMKALGLMEQVGDMRFSRDHNPGTRTFFVDEVSMYP